MIKVLVLEDSPVVREFLIYILGADTDIRVVGSANNGVEALEAAQRYHPDVITMDIHMPKMDGLEATRRIMEVHPVPIVIVSGSTDPNDVAMIFRATEAGAVAFMRKPFGIGHPEYEAAVNIAECMRTAVEAQPFDVNAGALLRITVSIGFPAHANNAQALVAAADAAMYAAKQGGRNRVNRYEPAPGQTAAEG